MPEGPSPRNLTEIELTPRAVAEREVALKLEQVELQRDILAIRKKDLEGAKKSRLGNIGISPLTTSVIAGLVGLIGTGVGAGAQGWFNRQLERDKFEFTKQIERQKNEANLILKLVETGNPEKAKTNLLFLVKAGFIQDTDGRIAALANDTATVPVLPKPSGTSSETVTIPLGTTLPDEQSYTVGEGDVYL